MGAPDYIYSTKLYNENGVVLKDFGNVVGVSPFITVNGDIKLYNSINGEIYSLNRNVSSIQKSIQKEVKPAYPNPAISRITIPYRLDAGEQASLYVYSLSGELLKELQIDYNFDKIELDVSSFIPGEYVYKYKDISRKFIVK